MDVIRDVVEMLTICHETDDERRALVQVCEAVRDRIGASTVALFPAERPHEALASAGQDAAAGAGVARRALETNLAIPPGVGPRGREAAFPVRYAGRVRGVLSVMPMAGTGAGWGGQRGRALNSGCDRLCAVRQRGDRPHASACPVGR